MRSILAVTTFIELVTNKFLFDNRYDDHQVKSARYRLNGKVLQVVVAELSQPIMLIFSPRQVDVLANWSGEIDCTIKAPLSTFAKLRHSQQVTSLIREHHLIVEGDVTILQQLATLAELIDWNVADDLAPYVGDVMAYRVSRHLQSTTEYLKNLFNRQQNNFTEIVKEEWFMLPNPLELAFLSDRVAQLAHDVDAISHRVEKLSSDDDSC